MGKFIDFTGQKFGSLTVISFFGVKNKRSYWNCICDCGAEIISWQGNLRNRKSCGKKECCNPTFIEDLSGKTFSYLKVIKYELRKGWLCECECGKTSYVKGWSLVNGLTKSCGCKSYILNAKAHLLPDNMSFVNKLYSIYKRGAESRKLIFNLSLEQVKELTSQNCFYCGSPPIEKSHMKRKYFDNNFKSNGIDRKDNTVGYTPNNSVSCCKICNKAKCNMKYDEFINWLDAISNFRKTIK